MISNSDDARDNAAESTSLATGRSRPQSPTNFVGLDREPSSARIAWAIHAFTASGIVLGLFGLLAVLDEDPKACLLWLLAAQVVDGIDGPFARHCQVKKRVPSLDGNTLDLVIDYVTCVVIPVAFLYQFEMLPHAIAVPLCGLILFTSALWFSRTDQMTSDNWFNGFPAEWNMVVPTLFLLRASPAVCAISIVFFAAITMTNIKVVHPMQVMRYRPLTLTITIVWLASFAVLTIAWPTTYFPGDLMLLIAPLYFVWLSAERSYRADRQVDKTPSATTI